MASLGLPIPAAIWYCHLASSRAPPTRSCTCSDVWRVRLVRERAYDAGFAGLSVLWAAVKPGVPGSCLLQLTACSATPTAAGTPATSASYPGPRSPGPLKSVQQRDADDHAAAPAWWLSAAVLTHLHIEMPSAWIFCRKSSFCCSVVAKAPSGGPDLVEVCGAHGASGRSPTCPPACAATSAPRPAACPARPVAGAASQLGNCGRGSSRRPRRSR